LPKEKGLNRTAWNLSQDGARPRRPPTTEQLEFQGPPRGPQALPGIYTVKLFVGDKMMSENKVEVKIDPTVQISPADLQTQFDLALKLRDMLSVMNDGLRQLDSLKLQSDQIEQLGKERLTEVPADLTKAIADYKKRIDTLLETLATNPEDGIRSPSRFADQLGGLYFTINDGNSAPTPTMRDNYELLRRELPAKIDTINKFVSGDTAEFNKTLQRFGLSAIVSGKGIDPPR
jgi:hypothetical protein